MRYIFILIILTSIIVVKADVKDSVLFSEKGDRALIFHDLIRNNDSIGAVCGENWDLVKLGTNEVEFHVFIWNDSVYFFKGDFRDWNSFKDQCFKTKHPDLRRMKLSNFLEIYQLNQKGIRSSKEHEIEVEMKRGPVIETNETKCGKTDSYNEWYTILVSQGGETICRLYDSVSFDVSIEMTENYRKNKWNKSIEKRTKFTNWESENAKATLSVLDYGVSAAIARCYNYQWELMVTSAARISFVLRKIE